MFGGLRSFLRWSGPRFLIVRHPKYRKHFLDIIADWVRVAFPEFHPLFELRVLPCRFVYWSDIVLHVPWLQDPVQRWSVEAYEQANRLAAECDRRGIPIVNRVDRLLNASKSVGAQLMAQAGVRTPQMMPIHDPAEFKETLLGMTPPLFVREDWGHGGRSYRIDKREDALQIPFEKIARPVAIELIDVRDRRDGLYRKYRYVAVGSEGVSLHLHASTDWIVRGNRRLKDETTRAEELSYISKQDPNHQLLQCAHRALGLDFVAYDYSYDHQGRVVVWEANPFPLLHFSKECPMAYRDVAVHRTLRAILKMYLQYASLLVPDRLEQPYQEA